MGLPQLLAGLDVEKRHGEEDDGEQQHDQILHGVSHFAPSGASLTGFIFDYDSFEYRKDFLNKA
jgi:hypothetical protein